LEVELDYIPIKLQQYGIGLNGILLLILLLMKMEIFPKILTSCKLKLKLNLNYLLTSLEPPMIKIIKPTNVKIVQEEWKIFTSMNKIHHFVGKTVILMIDPNIANYYFHMIKQDSVHVEIIFVIYVVKNISVKILILLSIQNVAMIVILITIHLVKKDG